METFTDQVAEVNQGEDFGDAEDYLGYDDGVLTVETPDRPDGRDQAVASIGANGAIVFVMIDLGLPMDARRGAASGTGGGSGSWAGYTAEWVVSKDPFVLGLQVTSN